MQTPTTSAMDTQEQIRTTRMVLARSFFVFRHQVVGDGLHLIQQTH